PRIHDVQVAGCVRSHASRAVESCELTDSIGAPTETRFAGQRRYRPRLSNLPNGVVASVRNVQIACAVDGNPERGGEPRRGAGSIRAAGRARRSSQGSHLSGRRDLANDVVARVGDIDVASAVRREAGWLIEK